MSTATKKAILVVSFGTTHEGTRKATIDKIEERIREVFKNFEIRRAFTSQVVIKKLKARDGIVVDTLEEAMKKLIKEGFEDIIVQPLHLIPGIEYDYICEVVSRYEKKDINMRLGRPVLSNKCHDGYCPDDYAIMIEAIESLMCKEKAILFMGHGTSHAANICYTYFKNMLNSYGYNRAYITCINGYPSIKDIIKVLKREKIQNIRLIPFLLTAGEHVKKDMAGDEEDSLKSILIKEGFQVETYLKGLGEIEKFQDIYIQHIRDVIDENK